MASEVKGLAGQTARATGDVGGRIGAVRSTTAEVAEALDRVAQAIARTDRISAAVADGMGAQGQVIARIVAEVRAASAETHGTSGSMGSVRAAAETSADRARAMTAAVERMAAETEALKREIDAFVARADQGERRSHERLPYDGDVAVSWSGATAHVTALDISEGGLKVRGQLACRVGERVTLRLPLGEGTVEARVARVHGGEAGLLFVEDEATVGTVRRIIAGLAGARALAA